MEKNIATIYCIENKLNNKKYIGFDSQYPRRIKAHKSRYSKYDFCCKLYRAIRKYGIDNFDFYPIYQSHDKDYVLNVMENYFINLWNTAENGYNVTLGGEGTLGLPRPKSEKWRTNQSIKMSGKNNSRYNHVYSQEEKEKHSKIMKEYYKNHPEKIMKGEKNGMYGKPHTDEWKQNHSNIMRKKV